MRSRAVHTRKFSPSIADRISSHEILPNSRLPSILLLLEHYPVTGINSERACDGYLLKIWL
jgi:hypothetical protein